MELKHFLHGSLITKNFQTTWYPDVVKLGGEEAMRTFWKRHASCTNCPTHCLKLGVLRSGKYAGLVAEGPEYESGGLLGTNLGMTNFDQMIALIEACDAYGLDNISTGGVLGFATEAMEKGALKPADLDGLKPKWGDGDTYMEMIRKIAYQEGKAGKLMAKGVAKMSKEIGKGSEAYANTVKGKELAAHDPRGDKIRAYSYTMGTNGGDHHEGQGPQALAMTTMADSLCICSFTNFLVYGAGTDKVITDMLNPLCGWNWKTEDYWTTAKTDHDGSSASSTSARASAPRTTGCRTACSKEKLPAGPKKDAIFTDADQKDMETKTYGFFGWDAKGIPTEASLKAYGLDYLIADVNAAKKKYNL